jgi:acetoin utilization deacetylase AcuC-like enzyme
MDIIYSEDHRKRAPKTELCGGLLVPPFECPERMDFIVNEIRSTGIGSISEPEDFGRKAITAIHDEGYVTFIETCWQEWLDAGYKGEAIATVWPSRSMFSQNIPSHIGGKIGYYALASETSISAGTAEAVYIAAQVALTGADRIISGASKMIFSLCRPPGHHASKDQYGGYSFYNNAAIAAQHLREQGAKKVAILDVDFHHGNGTQTIFYDRDDVLFLSIHGDPAVAFPYFLGYAEEKGIGPGKGFNANYPLPPETPYAIWVKALDDALNRISAYSPDVVIISFGADTFEDDPISFFKLTSADFTDMGKRIAGLKLPTLTVMEGGYAVKDIGINTVNLLMGMEKV